MSVFHYSTKEKRAPGYGCVAGYVDGGATCQMMSSAPVDAAVAELFLAAVTPAQVDVALRALDAYEAEQAEARRQRQMQIQQAEYEVEIARRRYEATDPANRLVAAELEARWEQALRERERLIREAEELDRQAASPLGAAERRRVREMADDLGKVWHAATTRMEDRKELLAVPGSSGVSGRGDRGRADPDRGGVAHRGADAGDGAAPGGRGVGPEDAGGGGRADPRVATGCTTTRRSPRMLNAEGFRTAKGLKFDLYSVGYVARSRGWGQVSGEATGRRCVIPCALCHGAFQTQEKTVVAVGRVVQAVVVAQQRPEHSRTSRTRGTQSGSERARRLASRPRTNADVIKAEFGEDGLEAAATLDRLSRCALGPRRRSRRGRGASPARRPRRPGRTGGRSTPCAQPLAGGSIGGRRRWPFDRDDGRGPWRNATPAGGQAR